MSVALTSKEHRLLEAASITAGGGLYDGCHWDAAPKVFARLERMGLVSLSQPHNPSHKARAVTTAYGDLVLATAQPKEPA